VCAPAITQSQVQCEATYVGDMGVYQFSELLGTVSAIPLSDLADYEPLPVNSINNKSTFALKHSVIC
jgi:hypothetical protein